MWIKRPWNASDIARTLCIVESTNNIKIKITHKVVGDECIWEGISLMNAVFYQVLNAVFRRKCLIC